MSSASNSSEEKDTFMFAVPRHDTPMDMSLSEEERVRRTAFYKKIEEQKAAGKLVLDCPKCLLLFSDAILHRMHMVMHGIGPSPSSTWQCSMCGRQCADRRQFLTHTIMYAHSLIPSGLIVPPTLTYHCGLPDLSSLCPASDLLEQLIKNGNH
ncbi:unnamed protein product [Caenorhabditis sp. 36 PRJEB53466]|nr:unnamed protein product [Caenorhabditis sp. 36 PRJEB53466]